MIRGIHDLHIEYLPDLARFCWSNYTCSYRPICLVKKGGDPQSSPRLSIHVQGLCFQIMVKHEKLWSGLRLPGWWILMGVLPWPHDSTPPWILQWVRQASDLGASLQAKPLRQRPDELLNARKGSADFRFFASKMRDVTNKLLEYSIVFYWYYNS